jgi:hypothetical protein
MACSPINGCLFCANFPLSNVVGDPTKKECKGTQLIDNCLQYMTETVCMICKNGYTWQGNPTGSTCTINPQGVSTDCLGAENMVEPTGTAMTLANIECKAC